MNTQQIRDQALENAVTLALQSGDEMVMAEVWQWAQTHQFNAVEIQTKFREVYEQLTTPTLPQSQPVAQLPPPPASTAVPQSAIAPTHQPDPRIQFPTHLETDPAPPKAPDQDSPSEMVQAIIDTYALFGIELSPGDPSYLIGPRIYQLRFRPKPTSKPLATPSIEEKLVIHAGLPEKGTIIRPRPGFLEIQVPRRKWESWNLLDHVRGRALTATTPLVLPYGVNLDCQVATFETIHALIAGMTQGGKTTFEMALITAAQLWYPPDHLRLVLIDPTKAGFVQHFSDSPWLWKPVVTDPGEAIDTLDELLAEYEARGELFAAHGVARLEEYNKLNPSRVLPRTLTFIDELYAAKNPFYAGNSLGLVNKEIDDLNKARSSEFDFRLTRLAREAAKRGLHFFPSTQKPTNNSISTDVRDSMPTKISFYLASKANGEVVFGSSREGELAHQLQGKGDMFVQSSEDGQMHRVQGFNVTESDIRKVIAQGIRHYGEWHEPRKANQGSLFVTPRVSSQPVNTNDPDYPLWEQYQQKIKTMPQSRVFVDLFGETYKSGKKFYEAKAKVEGWARKFGGVA